MKQSKWIIKSFLLQKMEAGVFVHMLICPLWIRFAIRLKMFATCRITRNLSSSSNISSLYSAALEHSCKNISISTFSNKALLIGQYRFPSLFAGVTLLRNLESVNTKTFYLRLIKAKIVFSHVIHGFLLFSGPIIAKPRKLRRGG